MNNPYLRVFLSLPSSFRRNPTVPLDDSELTSHDWLMLKAAIATHFAWAVPSEKAIHTVAQYTDRIVEIGCGSGYWAWLLEQKGVSVRAFDTHAPAFSWHVVERGDERSVTDHPDRTLFLCWPPHASSMAARALRAYRGKHLVFVGEWMGGCADSTFFHLLAAQYRLVAFVPLPQWYMRDDQLMVFERR